MNGDPSADLFLSKAGYFSFTRRELCSQSLWPWAGGIRPFLQGSEAALQLLVNICKCPAPQTGSQMHLHLRESRGESFFKLSGQEGSRGKPERWQIAM